MKTQITIATLILSLAAASSTFAMDKMASDKMATGEMAGGAMSSDHMAADHMAKDKMAKKPMVKKAMKKMACDGELSLTHKGGGIFVSNFVLKRTHFAGSKTMVNEIRQEQSLRDERAHLRLLCESKTK